MQDLGHGLWSLALLWYHQCNTPSPYGQVCYVFLLLT